MELIISTHIDARKCRCPHHTAKISARTRQSTDEQSRSPRPGGAGDTVKQASSKRSALKNARAAVDTEVFHLPRLSSQQGETDGWFVKSDLVSVGKRPRERTELC